jgi:hypothetical protein
MNNRLRDVRCCKCLCRGRPSAHLSVFIWLMVLLFLIWLMLWGFYGICADRCEGKMCFELCHPKRNAVRKIESSLLFGVSWCFASSEMVMSS